MTTFTTYCVNSPVGTMYSGIPSLDVALSLAADLSRYRINDNWYDDEDDTLDRFEVEVQHVPADDPESCGREWWLVTSEWNPRGVGVSVEDRCECCRRTL